MTDSEIRIAIAEACGWKWTDSCTFAFGATEPLKHWVSPQGKDYGIHPSIPDYCNDLNAMSEAEKALSETGHERANYADFLLHALCGDDEVCDDMFAVITASPRQRAEAFLSALGKWKE